MPNKSHLTPSHVHHCISGMPFPAMRRDIIEYARNKGADTGVIDFLEKLPEQEFKSEAEVTAVLDQPAGGK